MDEESGSVQQASSITLANGKGGKSSHKVFPVGDYEIDDILNCSPEDSTKRTARKYFVKWTDLWNWGADG